MQPDLTHLSGEEPAPLIKEASRYVVVGGISTVVDMVVLFMMAEIGGVSYILASIISFLCGAIINYFLCIAWVFEFRRLTKKRYEIMFYLAITLVALGVNVVLMWFFTEVVGVYFMVSKVIAVFFTFFVNFSMRKVLLHLE